MELPKELQDENTKESLRVYISLYSRSLMMKHIRDFENWEKCAKDCATAKRHLIGKFGEPAKRYLKHIHETEKEIFKKFRARIKAEKQASEKESAAYPLLAQ